MLHNAPQYSTVLRSTRQQSTILYSIPQSSLHGTPQCSLHNTPQYSTVIHSTPLYSAVLRSTHCIPGFMALYYIQPTLSRFEKSLSDDNYIERTVIFKKTDLMRNIFNFMFYHFKLNQHQFYTDALFDVLRWFSGECMTHHIRCFQMFPGFMAL